MGATLISNFDLRSKLPLDSRVVRLTLVSRDAIPSYQRFDGLKCYVVENTKNYQLQGGVVNANWVDISTTSVSIATSLAAGIVKPSTGLAITIDGTLTLVTASSSVLGGVKIGAGLTMTGDTVSVTNPYVTIPNASGSVFGLVKIGTGISVVNGVISIPAVAHTHYQLYQPDGTNPFVYTDNSGQLHINGNIVQSGASYETHAEQVYTKDNLIILRDGAIGGMGVGEYAGFTAKLYDGLVDGQLVFDKDGIARVGDVGNLQPITTRTETPTNGQFAYWEASSTRLNFRAINEMVYPGVGIPLSTGTEWGVSIVNNSANWNTAYGWGNHASGGYAPIASPTFTGIMTTPGVTVRSSVSTDGGLTLTTGDGTTQGYLGWYKPNNIRIACMGAGTTNLLLQLENSATLGIMGGNVGIGTITPAGRLDVNGDGYFGKQDYSIQGVQNALTLRGDTVSGVYATNSYKFYTTPGALNTVQKLSIRAEYNGSESSDLLTIQGNGYVGIGTTIPWAKLSIASTGNETIPIFSIGDSAYGWNIYERDANGDLLIKANNNSLLDVITLKRSNGNVGIGTILPIQLLHQASTSAANYHLFTNSNAANGLKIGLDANGNSEIYTLDIKPLTIYTNNLKRIVVGSDGQFEIYNGATFKRLVITAAGVFNFYNGVSKRIATLDADGNFAAIGEIAAGATL